SAAALAESRTRRIVPRLRRSGSTGYSAFCLIIPRMVAGRCKHHAFQTDFNVTLFSGCGDRHASRLTHDRHMSAGSSPKNDDAPAEATPIASSLPSGGTWSGRFAEPMSARMQRFNASIDFEPRLADADIAASRAHARMLAHTNVISADDLRAIESGLAQIQGEIERGEFEFTRELEDVH